MYYKPSTISRKFSKHLFFMLIQSMDNKSYRCFVEFKYHKDSKFKNDDIKLSIGFVNVFLLGDAQMNVSVNVWQKLIWWLLFWQFICNKMGVFLNFSLNQSIAVGLLHTIQLVWPQEFGQQENPLVRRLQVDYWLRLDCRQVRLLKRDMIYKKRVY